MVKMEKKGVSGELMTLSCDWGNQGVRESGGQRVRGSENQRLWDCEYNLKLKT